MKRLFSVILTLCMALSLFLGNSLSADAADKTIHTVVVDSIPAMEIGGSIADAKATFLDVPEGCIADSYWNIWDVSANDGDGEWTKINEGTFTETDVYRLCLSFQTEDGYSFSDEFEVSYVDGLPGGDLWGTYDENDNLIWYCDMPIQSFAVAIYDVFITTPDVIAGNTATLEDIEFYSGDKLIPAENFDIEAEWVCEEHDYENVTGKTFEDGCVYSFDLTIKPHTGYYFAEGLNVVHNGVVDDFAFAATPTNYDYYYSKSLLAPIESIELSGLPSVKVGETMVDSLEAISDLDALSCEIFVNWWDENGDDVTGQTMKKGHVYTLQIEVNDFGYSPLSEDFVFIVDGTEYLPTSIDELNEQPTQAWLELEYDLSNDLNTDNDDAENNADIVIDNNTTSPKTGDSSMITIWMLLAVASMGTIVFVRKRQ